MKLINRKSKLKFQLTVFFVLLSLPLISCPDIFQPDNETGTILLIIGGTDVSYGKISGAERTIIPVMPGGLIEYKLEFTAKNYWNVNFSETWTGKTTGTISLQAGTWDLTVTAYLTGGIEAAKGVRENINVYTGISGTINVPLLPIEEGAGTFKWNINLDSSVRNASMEFWRTGETGNTLLNDKTIIFAENYVIQSAALNSNTSLDAGEYRVIFRLSNADENAVISEILHIYKSMESSFTQSFTNIHFPVSLLKIILSTWNGAKWNLTEQKVTAGHFSFLGINGVNSGNYTGVIRWFDTLCAGGGAPADLTGLKTLADIALIGLAGESAGFLNAANYIYRENAENAIKAPAVNGTLLTIIWDANNRSADAQAGVYKTSFLFSSALLVPTPGLAYTLINGGAAYSVSKGTAAAAEVVIPAVYNGLPVTAIADNGFLQHETLTSVNIPNSVTSIGSQAFMNCAGLISVTLGTISADNFNAENVFPGNLRDVYFGADGSAGTYTRTSGTDNNWTKQQ